MSFEELIVDPGPIVEALRVARGAERDQVPVAAVALREENQAVCAQTAVRLGLAVP